MADMAHRTDAYGARQVFVKQHGPAIAILCFVASVYLVLAFLVMPGRTFFSGDTGLRFVQVQTYVKHHWQQMSLDYPGREMDSDLQFFPLSGVKTTRGRLFPIISLPLPFLASLTYVRWGSAGVVIWPLLAGLGILIATYVLGRLIEVAYPALLVLNLGVGSPLIFYSLTFWDHTLGVFFATLGVCILVRAIKNESRRAFRFAGLALAVAVWNRPELYEFVAAVGLAYVLVFGWSWPTLQHGLDLGWGVAGGLVPLWVVNWSLYENVLGLSGPGIINIQQTQTHRALNQLHVATSFLAHGAPGRVPSTLLALSIVLLIAVMRAPFLRRPTLIIAAGLLCAVAYLPQLLFAQHNVAKGLLPTWPLLAFSFTYLDGDIRQSSPHQRVAPFLLFTTLLFLAFACLTSPVDGGLEWGPRYLLVLFPMVAVLAHNALTRLRRPKIPLTTRRAVSGIFGLLLVLAIGLQSLGVRQQYVRRQDLLSKQAALLKLPEETIVTDAPWFTTEMASIYSERTFFRVDTQPEYESLVETLRAHGVSRFAFVPHVDSPLNPVIQGATYRTQHLSGIEIEIVGGLNKN